MRNTSMKLVVESKWQNAFTIGIRPSVTPPEPKLMKLSGWNHRVTSVIVGGILISPASTCPRSPGYVVAMVTRETTRSLATGQNPSKYSRRLLGSCNAKSNVAEKVPWNSEEGSRLSRWSWRRTTGRPMPNIVEQKPRTSGLI